MTREHRRNSAANGYCWAGSQRSHSARSGASLRRTWRGSRAFSVLVSSGTVLAAIGMGQVGVTGGALFYLISSTLGLGAFFLLIELVERGREPGADVLAVTREVYGEEDDLEESSEVGIAIPATMGDPRSGLHRLRPCHLRPAAALRIHRQVCPPDSCAQSVDWRCLDCELGFASRSDPLGAGGPYRHDARRHPCVLGFAGPRCTTRASDRGGAGREPFCCSAQSRRSRPARSCASCRQRRNRCTPLTTISAASLVLPRSGRRA